MSVRHKFISRPTLLYDNSSNLNVILVSTFTFKSETSQELSVNKGDLLKFIDKKPGGWLLVKSLDNLNNCGLIPATYVDIAINDTSTPVSLNWLTAEDADVEAPQSLSKDVSIEPPLGSSPSHSAAIPVNQTPVTNYTTAFASPATHTGVFSPHRGLSGSSRQSSTRSATGYQVNSPYQANASVSSYPSNVTAYGATAHGAHAPSRTHSGPTISAPYTHTSTTISSPDTHTNISSDPYQTPTASYSHGSSRSNSYNSYRSPSETHSVPSNPYAAPTTRSLSDSSTSNAMLTRSIDTSRSDIGPYARSNSDSSYPRPTDPYATPTLSRPDFKQRTQLNSVKNVVTSKPRDSFQNPYLQQKGPMKDFKAETFNKFKPSSSPIISPPMVSSIGPLSPSSPEDVFGATPRNSNHHYSDARIPNTPLSPQLKSLSSSPQTYKVNQSLSIIDFDSPEYDPMVKLISISISNCCLHNERYWYRIDLKYANSKVSIGKFYQDFYNLQVDILQHGNAPKLPAPIELNDVNTNALDNILRRCNELNNYINKVSKLGFTQFNDWINFKYNDRYYIVSDLNSTRISDNDINNRILDGSVNLLYKNLKVNLVNGTSSLSINVNKNEINSIEVLKTLVREQVFFNHLLVNVGNKFELIDTIKLDFIKMQDQIDLRVIS
ncbi:hypothetical protein PSN45_002709 [Yamadazyma tenuis]|uniref:uncharacterized protein n=1 Tax=Candida tenuis TaxID=2315449 RepID=UPI00279C16B7|nr:hypothetical protein PSN45_002709 [Yamadazyma tenuis]